MTEMEKILQNEDLMIGLVEAETPAELEALLSANGLSLAEGLTAEKAFELVKAQEKQELGEDELDDVSGGILLSTAIGATAALALAATELCFFAGYAYQTYKNAKASKKKKKK